LEFEHAGDDDASCSLINGDAMNLQTTRPSTLRTVKTHAFGRSLHRIRMMLASLRPTRYARLDLQSMPEHLQRDLGFLDGRDPRYEAPERR
jgi:uncharacterized protein YjiS (DUF1127 family)